MAEVFIFSNLCSIFLSTGNIGKGAVIFHSGYQSEGF